METITKSTKIHYESKIQLLIEEDNCNKNSVHFKYEPSISNGINLSIITHNPVCDTSFLYHKSWGATEELALISAFKYLKSHKNIENNYTVEWFEKNKPIVISYFTGIDIFDVLNKFYHDKNPNNFTILLIKLSPIA